MSNGNHIKVSSGGENPDAAKAVLDAVLQNGFDGDINRLGIVLGRPNDELSQFLAGEEVIDDDLLMKMRGIALQRGIQID